jgi:hypothetical protein
MQPPEFEGYAHREREACPDEHYGMESHEESLLPLVVDAGWNLHLAKNPFA